MIDDREILQRLRTRDIAAFKALVQEYSEDMLLLAYSLLGDSDMANTIVEDLLATLWKEADFVGAPSLHQFLYSETKKACANQS